MLSNHPHTAVFLGSAIKNNAQPNKAEHYLSVCAQLKVCDKCGLCNATETLKPHISSGNIGLHPIQPKYFLQVQISKC